LAKIKKNKPSYRLLVVGGPDDVPDFSKCPELLRLSMLAKQEGVEGSVTFTGRKQREVLKYYYSAADIFITTPWYEPFGITPLEAMACGTPVIGSNVGGIKYTVEEGKTGFLVPPNDPDALASKIETLMCDERLFNAMQHNSTKRVNKHFTWKSVALSCHCLYEKILLAKKRESVRSNVITLESLSLKNASYLLNDPFYLAQNYSALNE